MSDPPLDIALRYFGKFNKARQDRWVFGDRDSGAYLHKFSWTRIVRHQIVKHGASPDDPVLADYWTQRRRKTPLPINPTTRRLHAAQDGRCAICHGALYADEQPRSPENWEQWLWNARARIIIRGHGNPDEADLRLIHSDCHMAAARHPLPAKPPPRLA